VSSIGCYVEENNIEGLLVPLSLTYCSIAGHSMGGQAAHRYAVLKKQKYYDDNMSYWVGNPG
jgi:pimeloyl-ACP methyl ester carboxylesterase